MKERAVILKKLPKNLKEIKVRQWKVLMTLLTKATFSLLNQLHLRYLLQLILKCFFR